MNNKIIGLISVVVVIGLVIIGIVFMGGESEPQEPKPEQSSSQEEQTNQTDKEAKTAPGWEINTIKEGMSYMNDFNMVMDSEDKLHLVYQDTESHNVVHAYQVDQQWEEEVIAEMGVGSSDAYPEIALQDGEIRVAFFGKDGLVYAQRKDGEWSKEVVDSDAESAGKVSLVVGNKPHVFYTRLDLSSEGNMESVYAVKAEEGWQSKTIKPKLIREVTLALNNGNVYLSYVDEDKLYYDSLKDGQWNFEEVDKKISGSDNAIVFENDVPKLVYLKSVKTDTYPREATLKEGSWSIEKINTKEAAGGKGISVTFNKEGNLCAVYGYNKWNYDANLSWGELIYVEKKNGQWGQTVIRRTAKQKEEKAEDVGKPILSFDSNGKSHVVYNLTVKEGGETSYSWRHAYEK